MSRIFSHEKTKATGSTWLWRGLAAGFMLCGGVMLCLRWNVGGYKVAFDRNGDATCLPNMHLIVLQEKADLAVGQGSVVYWESTPASPIQVDKAVLLIKMVAGVPGDHLVIADNAVSINGKVVVQGMALRARYYPNQRLERDEVIPEGKLFVVGTHALSNDSRYWGYLDRSLVKGWARGLF